jgi:hypothetical protein
VFANLNGAERIVAPDQLRQHTLPVEQRRGAKVFAVEVK